MKKQIKPSFLLQMEADKLFQLPAIPQKMFLLIGCFFLVTANLQGQCSPDRNGTWKHITGIIDSAKITYKIKLGILTADLDKMNNCHYKNDSTHAFLLQVIGEAYFHQSDFLNAVKYYRQSINMITANAGKPAVNAKNLFYIITGYPMLMTH